MSFQPDPDSLPLPGEIHENDWYNQDFGGFRVSEQSMFKKRHVRLVVVGAGAVGLQVAYKAPQELEDFEFTIYEKNNDLGGTCKYP
jgi:NADPH-dependent 2,4-dienoyl-CoA reductase/sulfur reductase-like enzyme